MGSWSVYCGISKIAITAGDECVLVPLKKNKGQNWDYFTYRPLTLPIFGIYNDYGGIEDIEENENTKLISEYFGCTIQQFCDWFTEETTYKRGEVSQSNFTHFDEIKNASFMWINREVYDYMSQITFEKGHLDFGNPEILKLIGFTHVGKSNIERYTEKYIFGDKELYSDGHWVYLPNGQSIFTFNGYSSLSDYITIPEDKKWIGDKSMVQLWEHLSDKRIKEAFMPILLGRHYDGHEELVESMLKYLTPEQIKNYTIKDKSIADVYKNRLRDFGNEFAGLVTLSYNLRPMSSTFEPYILYLTPQCGEFSYHQKLLDKFAEINKTKIEEDED